MDATVVRTGLYVAYDTRLVDELMAAHAEAKRNFFAGGLRLSAVEGGRFCEAAYRMLQELTTKTFTPLGAQLDTDGVANELAHLPRGAFSDSIRLHIPRSLRLVYDIRNKRDTAHLADGIDPNTQDSSLVVAVVDWVLAEFVRLHHAVSADAAEKIVRDLVTRSAPAVEDFEGFLKVLRVDIVASDFVALLLYQRGREGASVDDLDQWVKPSMRKNLRRTLNRLVYEKAYVHFGSGRYFITLAGQQYVERTKLLHAA